MNEQEEEQQDGWVVRAQKTGAGNNATVITIPRAFVDEHASVLAGSIASFDLDRDGITLVATFGDEETGIWNHRVLYRAGKQTLRMTLPAGWARKHRVAQGDRLYLRALDGGVTGFSIVPVEGGGE